MILSNKEILNAIMREKIKIGDLCGNEDPGEPPFNTTSVDLRLGTEINILRKDSAHAVDLRDIDLRQPDDHRDIKGLLRSNCEKIQLEKNGRPFVLDPMSMVLGKTEEYIDLSLDRYLTFAARIEGKSSRARCGLLVHCTAPTIHPNFHGHITLEIVNLSPWPFLLHPGMYLCQLIIETVQGEVHITKNQFIGQTSPTGDGQSPKQSPDTLH